MDKRNNCFNNFRWDFRKYEQIKAIINKLIFICLIADKIVEKLTELLFKVFIDNCLLYVPIYISFHLVIDPIHHMHSLIPFLYNVSFLHNVDFIVYSNEFH